MRLFLSLLLLVLVAPIARAEEEDLPPPPTAPVEEPAGEPVDEPEPADEDTPEPADEPEYADDLESAAPDDAPAHRTEPPIADAKQQPAPVLFFEVEASPTDGDTPAATAATAATAAITVVEKVHDRPWVGDKLALRLDVEFEVEECQAQSLFLAAWFATEPSGTLVTSLKRPFADGSGFLMAQTAPVEVEARHAVYTTSLWVPYGAFPAPTEGTSYQVEARLKLFRRSATDGSLVVAESTTTFTVHGPE